MGVTATPTFPINSPACALAQMGDYTDLPKLREIARNETETFAAQNRGFGLMPAINLSKAAQTTIEAIEKANE